MPNIWKGLREICDKRGVQLFATTHSDECLQALRQSMDEHENDFSLIRTVAENGGHHVKHFAGAPFLAALEQHGQIR